MLLPYTSETCQPATNNFALALSGLLCIGLVISYLPQHLRIISKGSSEGLSPWYLLLGSTSSACGFFNLLILQWPLMGCCKLISNASCFSSLLGLMQVGMQWLLFTIIFVLFLIFFPPHLKYETPMLEGAPVKQGSTTRLWKLSMGLASLTGVHFVVTLAVILSMLLHYPLPLPTPTQPPHPALARTADILGLAATALAVSQYLPQILLTWREGFVGALSIPTMMIQVPGSVAFVISIAIREGTSWSSWFPYAITGFLQAGLLAMCITFKRRQARLGIDDFGNSLNPGLGVFQDEQTPLLVDRS